MKEANLIRRLQAGNRFALSQAMDTYTSYLSAVVWHTMGPAATAQDVEEVVSDAFLALWSHRQTLDAEKGLKPWLAAVARNKAADWLRRCRPADPIPDNAPDPSPGPEELTQRREQSARLWAAVDALEEPDRTLFLRYYYEGDKLKTVAAELGLSQTAAKQRMFRGRKALKAALKGVETP